MCIRRKFDTWPTWGSAWMTLGMTCRKALLTVIDGAKRHQSCHSCVHEKGSHFEHLLWYLGSHADLIVHVDKLDFFLVCATVMFNFGCFNYAVDLFPQGSEQQYVGETGNCCVAHQLSVFCAKHHRHWLTFAETVVKWRGWSPFEHVYIWQYGTSSPAVAERPRDVRVCQ